MNIAFFSKQLPSDESNGVSVQVHRLAEALIRRGHTVTVFTFSPKPKGATYECVTFKHQLPYAFTRKFTPAATFAGVNISNYDIVHYHGDDYLCRGSKRRLRTFYGSALMEAIYAGSCGRFFYQALFYLFEWISCLKKGSSVAISQNTRTCLPLIKECIPCCVPLDFYRPEPVKTSYPSVLFIGTLSGRKRGRILLDAFASVVLDRFPNAVLTVAGQEPCGGQGIRYVGRPGETDLIKEYQATWVLCMPSSYEGFGVPLLEAMACGTTVIATRNQGSNAIIQNEANGLLCSKKNLGEALCRLFADSALRESLIAGGIKTVQSYDWAIIAEKYEKLYTDTVTNRHP